MVRKEKELHMAKKSGYRDEKAPKFLKVTIADDQGVVLKDLVLPAKEFSTGSVGYYGSDKMTNFSNPEAQYQLGLTATLVGSK
jgi:hypothetical protein